MPSPRQYKLGRHPRRFGNVYHYGQMRAMLRASGAQLPALLPEVDNAATLPPDLGMMLNGPDSAGATLPILGDCTSAAPAHVIQTLSMDAQGAMLTPTNGNVETFYEETGHYVPGDPSTDNGANMQDVVAHLSAVGYPLPDGSRHRPLTPPIEIDVRLITDVCEAIQEFGFVDVGFQVMAEFMEIGPPDLWDADPRYRTLEGGHCVAIVGFEWSADRSTVTFVVVSWGTHEWRMAQAFFERFVDEAYTWVDPLWIAKTGKTPMGLTAEQLEAICSIGRPFSSAASDARGDAEAARLGVARSGRWPAARAAHLLASPVCLVSGSMDDLEIHHDEPFHLCVLAGRDDLELDQRNLRTLTRTAGNDLHLVVGHLDDFRSSNPDLDNCIARWRGRTETGLRTDPEWQAAHADRPRPWDAWTAEERSAYRARLDQRYPATAP